MDEKNGIHERKSFAVGQVIFREGELASEAYVIQTGGVRIYRTIDDVEVVLADIGPNTIFGEFALIDLAPRVASARAIGPTTCIVLRNETVQKMLHEAPKGLTVLVHSLVRTARNTSDTLARTLALMEKRKAKPPA